MKKNTLILFQDREHQIDPLSELLKAGAKTLMIRRCWFNVVA